MRYLAASAAVLGLAATTASAAITVSWAPVTISAAAIAQDPALANMQTYDLVATTDGDWASAGLRATLPAGQNFYNHAFGGNTKPNPALVPAFAGLAFDTYVSGPGDTGAAGAPAILGGFPEGDPVSMAGNHLSVSWGDLVPDAPGTYQIARLTFPRGVLPDILNNDPQTVPNPSRTSQVNPDSTVFIPDIPEPTTLGLVAAAGLMALRRRK